MPKKQLSLFQIEYEVPKLTVQQIQDLKDRIKAYEPLADLARQEHEENPKNGMMWIDTVVKNHILGEMHRRLEEDTKG